MSDISRGEVLYRRARSFAKAAFIAAAVILVAGVCLSFSRYPLHRSVFLDSGVNEQGAGGLEVILSRVNVYVFNAFLIAAGAFLLLIAARAAAADSRPTWAPLVDEKFARRADTFALITLGYAGISILFYVLDIIQAGVRAAGGTSSQFFSGMAAMNVIGMAVWAASKLFFIVTVALIIQSLVVVATSDYGQAKGGPDVR